MVIQYHGKRYSWSWRKCMFNLLVMVIIISFWMVYVSNTAKALSEKKAVYITVHHGDTLWSIAQTVAPEADPRMVIRRIKTNNQLTSANLEAGQKLKLELTSY